MPLPGIDMNLQAGQCISQVCVTVKTLGGEATVWGKPCLVGIDCRRNSTSADIMAEAASTQTERIQGVRMGGELRRLPRYRRTAEEFCRTEDRNTALRINCMPADDFHLVLIHYLCATVIFNGLFKEQRWSSSRVVRFFYVRVQSSGMYVLNCRSPNAMSKLSTRK